ncbi:MAG: DUF2520 domain-containing protein [Acidimicrobiaceae bacterium]|nr:DUF2520 domain-containing protein [Acidimicrobiaceae bacterium]
MKKVRIIGGGRAGKSLGNALASVGWEVLGYLGRDNDLGTASVGTDVLVIATPDDKIASVAESVRPTPTTLVLHLSGASGLDVLKGHPRCAAMHPLVSLPSADLGAERLRGAWFAVAGDAEVDSLVTALGGRSFAITDSARPLYHAAAVISSNHLVALLGQAERVADLAGVPLEVMLDLARDTVDNVRRLGPAAALTGPAARGDEATIARHLKALPPDERAVYETLLNEAKRLAES